MKSDTTKPVLDEVFAERLRQEELMAAGKFLWACVDPGKAHSEKLAVLSEQFGEAARAQEKATEWTRRLRKELIQVAAVAVAWAESLPRE